MFVLGVRYLMGRVIATHPADRLHAEWPPHPDRLFMALVAAFGETGGDLAEERALTWLEEQGAPSLWASPAHPRTPTTSFVPVNDSASPLGKKKPFPLAGSLSIGRDRQPRQFPAVVPDDDRVFFIWEREPEPLIRATLAGLCAKVTYLGHSSTPVQAWVEEAPPPPNLVPTDSIASVRLRVSGPGRLAALRARHAAGLRPLSSLWQGYAPPAPTPEVPRMAHSVFQEELVVLRQTDGRRFGMDSTLQLTRGLRGLVMGLGPQPVPEWISGHRSGSGGGRSESPHLAYLPLPFVGDEHADGHLLGMALALPRGLSLEEMASLWGVLEDEPGGLRPLRVVLGSQGDCVLEWDARAPRTRPRALQTDTWCAPARRWASATPVVFDTYPKSDGEAEETVARACERVGLPRPAEVIVSGTSLLTGVPPAWTFAPVPAKDSRPQRWHRHVVVIFTELVTGPVLLGAGRYQGYGLCRPCREGGTR
jgi:CRISPR-associated protein Csb2